MKLCFVGIHKWRWVWRYHRDVFDHWFGMSLGAGWLPTGHRSCSHCQKKKLFK